VRPAGFQVGGDPAAEKKPSDTKDEGAKNDGLPDLSRNATDPDDLWFDYFEKRKPSLENVQKLVTKLHAAKKHDHVIAIINAALATGQSQPWMYDVLALSMELDKRPQEEIERVLLSRVDFTTTDVPSLMYSAAFIKRMGGGKQALRLYRQASRLDPTRPEPYVLGMSLARELKDYDAVKWSCAGTLTHAWTKDRVKRHQDAQDAAVESETELRKAGRNEEADQLKAAIAEASRRDLILLLEWAGDADLDLSVEEPLGTICSIENPLSEGGGVLVHDGYGPKTENCYDEYACVLGASGDYRAIIRFVQGKVVGNRCQLTIIRYRGTKDEVIRKLTVPIDKRVKTVRLSLHNGRRKETGPAQTAEEPSGSRRSRRDVMAQLFERAQRGAGRNTDRLRAGAFAAGVGFAPIVGFIPEGVTLTAMAVVSADRRYVRLALAPMFNSIVDVATFSFITGQTTGGGAQGGGGQGGGGQGGAQGP